MENKSHCLSKYLTKKENDFIVESVGNRAICLSIGVAQLWLDLSKRQVWSLYGQGAAVFVRDPIRKGFFIVVRSRNTLVSLIRQRAKRAASLEKSLG